MESGKSKSRGFSWRSILEGTFLGEISKVKGKITGLIPEGIRKAATKGLKWDEYKLEGKTIHPQVESSRRSASIQTGGRRIKGRSMSDEAITKLIINRGRKIERFLGGLQWEENICLLEIGGFCGLKPRCFVL
jgi:hypothetical protein